MIKIGIVGDYNPNSETHQATDLSFELAGTILDIPIRTKWLSTQQIAESDLMESHALLFNTGVYEDRDKVLTLIRVARESGIPTLAACGGFQHLILEFARNVAKIEAIGHAEFDGDGSTNIIVPLACSLRGREMALSLVSDSQVGKLYGASCTTERYYCSYGVCPSYIHSLVEHGLKVSGSDDEGILRVTELPSHPFYLGTLFVPQAWALGSRLHPLIAGLVQAGATRV